ncbi:MAG: hypothetical protein HFG20_07305 [Anaerotruncus sp.]|nr:hypothetical protein [Anaerotruncus sp.]
MANLKGEYTDIRNRTHMVEHILIPAENKEAKEQMLEELLDMLKELGEKSPT